MNKTFKTIMVSLIILMFVVGCSNNNEEPKDNNDEPSAEVNDNEKDEKKEKKDDNQTDSAVKSSTLKKWMNADKYTVKFKNTIDVDGQLIESTILNVVSGDTIYSKNETSGMTMEFLEKGDHLYLFDAKEKTIIKTNRYTDEDDEVSNPSIIYDDLKYVGKGKEDFMGTPMNYEEYEVEEGNIKYFIDKNELKGMKSYFTGEDLFGEDYEDDDFDEIVMTFEFISYEEKVDESVFEIPDDYKVLGE